jgi:hypothetical protein
MVALHSYGCQQLPHLLRCERRVGKSSNPRLMLQDTCNLLVMSSSNLSHALVHKLDQ